MDKGGQLLLVKIFWSTVTIRSCRLIITVSHTLIWCKCIFLSLLIICFKLIFELSWKQIFFCLMNKLSNLIWRIIYCVDVVFGEFQETLSLPSLHDSLIIILVTAGLHFSQGVKQSLVLWCFQFNPLLSIYSTLTGKQVKGGEAFVNISPSRFRKRMFGRRPAAWRTERGLSWQAARSRRLKMIQNDSDELLFLINTSHVHFSHNELNLKLRRFTFVTDVPSLALYYLHFRVAVASYYLF